MVSRSFKIINIQAISHQFNQNSTGENLKPVFLSDDPNDMQGKRNPALCLTHILSILLGMFLKFIVYVHDVCMSEDVNVYARYLCASCNFVKSVLSYLYVGPGDPT